MKTPLISILLFFALSIAVSAPCAETGSILYAKHCSACHGDRGQGATAPALRKQGLLQTIDSSYIINTIRFGRQFRGMPSFKTLSDNDAGGLASYIKSWQTENTLAAPQNNVEPKDSQRGKEMFALCGGCHGLDGEGAMGPPLLDKGFLNSISDTELRRTIMYGRPGTPMKGYIKGMGGLAVFSQAEIDTLISYIRFRQKNLE
ncbi:MAG: c-type cytochrome [Deltaproteobacteria bacterium]|nr:c-type cytochrome [Deltaproteobacteria bacterium]